MGTKYGSVVMEKDKIFTRQSIDNQGVSARMGQGSEVDLDLVMFCAIACLGMKQLEGRELATLLGQWIRKHKA
jgi:hypothetical protein